MYLVAFGRSLVRKLASRGTPKTLAMTEVACPAVRANGISRWGVVTLGNFFRIALYDKVSWASTVTASRGYVATDSARAICHENERKSHAPRTL